VDLVPESLRDHDKAWVSRDVVAGLTLVAIALPEVMGYTSIAGTAIVIGVHTIIFPTLLFALRGSSRLFVVGADSATAGILAAGLIGLGIPGNPSPEPRPASTTIDRRRYCND
jgi:MFS superfamily sulfate permease-like transporter